MMQVFDIRSVPQIRFSGRFDPEQEGFPMMWTGASAEMNVRAGMLEVEITCGYHDLKPYLSFEVDGLRAQIFSPVKGTHWYNVFLRMDGDAIHHVRITLETQAFDADPASCAVLTRVRADGSFEPLAASACRLELIGDSITSGEGLRGPRGFMEWVPMCFGASDSYARMLADRLNAQYQVLSQSGWGVVNSWDNMPQCNMPGVYDFICAPAAMGTGSGHGGEKLYDFSFRPDAVIINLGTNDATSLTKPPYVDAAGVSHRLTEGDMPLFEDACGRFIRHIHEKNPGARILWCFGVFENPQTRIVAKAIQGAIKKAAAEDIPAAYVPLKDMTILPDGVGSREHPGIGAHRMMAECLYQAMTAES